MSAPIRMYDNVTVSRLPAHARAVAGYIDGRYNSYPAMVARFYPHAHCVSITTEGHQGAAFCDCETGDLTPQQAINWVLAEIRDGRWRPGVYANLATWNAPVPGRADGKTLREALAPYGPKIRRWVAEWDGDPTIPDWADAKQYTDHGPGGCDVSSIRADFFPEPSPKPAATKPVAKKKAAPKVHPKVTAAGITGALTSVTLGVLAHHGIGVLHLGAGVAGAIATAAATIAAAYKKS